MRPTDMEGWRRLFEEDDEQARRIPFVLEHVQVLSEHPGLAWELLMMASEIVDDFDDWGAIVPGDEDGNYTEETAIERLRLARDAVYSLASGHPHELYPTDPPLYSPLASFPLRRPRR